VEVLKVLETVKESEICTTVLVRTASGHWSSLSPGQFVMVWIPGIDEVPMSVSSLEGDPPIIGITVQGIGEATNALCRLRTGDRIGIRGPYGRGFDLALPKGSTVVGVSGGVGSASTVLAMERARELGYRTVNLVGARSSSLLVFAERFIRNSDLTIVATDDGSRGHSGYVTDLLPEVLSSEKRPVIISCGPEVMMRKVMEIADEASVRCQLSLERYMKCGVGLCDSCSMSGRRVCQDGPVFDISEVRELSEFASSHRDRSGRSVPIGECVR